MAETYREWFIRQTPERQEESLSQMEKCARLGDLDRSTPRSEEAVALRREIAAYYKDFP